MSFDSIFILLPWQGRRASPDWPGLSWALPPTCWVAPKPIIRIQRKTRNGIQMGYVCVKKWRITNSTPHIPQSTMNDFRFSRFSLAGAFKQPNKNAKNALNNPLNNPIHVLWAHALCRSPRWRCRRRWWDREQTRRWLRNAWRNDEWKLVMRIWEKKRIWEYEKKRRRGEKKKRRVVEGSQKSCRVQCEFSARRMGGVN